MINLTLSPSIHVLLIMTKRRNSGEDKSRYVEGLMILIEKANSD